METNLDQPQVSKSVEKLQISQKDHMKETLKQLIHYSPEYNLNKINNYDNTILNVPRKIFETCDFSKEYPKDSRNMEFDEK